MYSTSTLSPLRYFDSWFGAHQKIDRVARRDLLALMAAESQPLTFFPTNRQLAHFEGFNGPDGIKRKSPGQAEPWHYYDPKNENDKQLLEIIAEHQGLIRAAIEGHDTIRLTFEAAWLAHAIVDGLTPAHHYPYERELTELRGGKGIETRTSIKEKLVLPGDTLRKRARNNWKMWGEKGLLSSHIAFEMGVATIITPIRYRTTQPSAADIEYLRRHGFGAYFKRQAQQIAQLGLYDDFIGSGWTPRLAKQVRRELVPIIINTVTLGWYDAIREQA
jgi:hypothetical protein